MAGCAQLVPGVCHTCGHLAIDVPAEAKKLDPVRSIYEFRYPLLPELSESPLESLAEQDCRSSGPSSGQRLRWVGQKHIRVTQQGPWRDLDQAGIPEILVHSRRVLRTSSSRFPP